MINTLSIALLAIIILFIVKDLLMLGKLRKFRNAAKLAEKEKSNSDSIIEQANDAILVIDIVDGKIHQANPSASQLLGYDTGQLIKKSLFDLHPPEYLERSSRIVADVWEKGGLIYKDIPFLTSKGELMPVECSARVAPFAGRPAIVIYARDIRERLRMEQEIQFQKSEIEQKNKDITDSINYARRIQSAILPQTEDLNINFPESFVLFKPKDIVSGDFYWFSQYGEWMLVAAADCTGHGVPGALMSMIGSNILNEVVKDRNITKPSLILEQLDRRVLETLKRSGEDKVKDGMDIVLCAFNLRSRAIDYSGANRPMVIVRNSVAMQYKPDKISIGGHAGVDKKFNDEHVQLQPGDSVYLFTDGYADQFGGESGKKFKIKNMLSLLESMQDKTMARQKEIMENSIDTWRGVKEQVDDILVIGLRV